MASVTVHTEIPRVGATWSQTAVVLAALGMVLTLLNVLKPLTSDDCVYYRFADHIAQHPLDPYDLRSMGVGNANAILAPPVFLYWWALAVRLFGQEPLVWKLWLLPISGLLVCTLYALARRFARGMELPFVAFLVLSPVVLPCLNLMLDIPALALSLSALLLFLRASSADSLKGAVLAGLVAGIATQTKYTAFVVPGVMLLYAALEGKWRQALIAVSLTAAIFVGWELVVAWRYGDSHFWLGFTQFRPSTHGKRNLIQPLFGYLGSTMAAAIPLGLAVLGQSRRVVVAAAALVVLGFALVALVPLAAFAALGEALHVTWWPKLGGVVFAFFGVVFTGIVGTIAWRLIRQPQFPRGTRGRGWLFSVDGFLVLWLALEVAGYFLISPYPATRRILGVVVVSMLLACRLGARTFSQGPPRMIWGVAAVNLSLGLLAFLADFNAYHGVEVMARNIAQTCRQSGPGVQIWLVGDPVLEFYGQRLGMRLLDAPGSMVAPGDWIVVGDGLRDRYAQHPAASRSVCQGAEEWSPVLPMRSQYQIGAVALARREEPVARIMVYRTLK